MKIVYCLFAVIAFFSFHSCSSTTTPSNPTTKSYLPLKQGNYWIYKRMVVDTVTHDVSGPTFTDSAFVMDEISMQGRSAHRVVYVQQDTTTRDTTYFSVGSDNAIYSFLNFNVEQLKQVTPQLVAPALWVQLVPGNEGVSTWTSLDTILKAVLIDLRALKLDTVRMDLQFSIMGKRGMTKPVVISGTSYIAQEFIATFSIVGGGGTVSFVVDQHYWFVENVGLVQSRTDDAQVASALGSLLKTNGTQSTVARFSLR